MSTRKLMVVRRKVKTTNKRSIDDICYEVDSRFAKQRVTIRFTPDMEEVYIVDAEDDLLPVRLLNKHENANVKRKQFRLSEVNEND